MSLVALCGPSGSGKTTLAELLVSAFGAVHVTAITTRAPRSAEAPHYTFITDEEFEEWALADAFAVVAEYADHKYGLLSTVLDSAIQSGRLAVVTVTVDAALALAENVKYRHLTTTVFLDASDAVLANRTGDRNSQLERQIAQGSERGQSTSCDLAIRDFSPEAAGVLVEFVARHKGMGGVLSGRVINAYLSCGLLLDGGERQSVQGASYDLRLGDEYYYGGEISRLSSKRPVLLIEPYDYAIVTSRERAKFPRDICASFDLSVGLFSQGVILSNGPQVDPGFNGTLFCLLFNTSSSPVLMKRGQHYATLVFQRVVEMTEPYSGAKQNKNSIVDYLPANAARGAINELKVEIEDLRERSLTLQNVFLAVIAVLVTVVALLLAGG